MTMKAIVSTDEFEALDAMLKAEYTAITGRAGFHQLDVSPVEGMTLANVTKLQTALQGERSSVKSLKEAAKTFDGIDAVKAREALTFFTEFQDGNFPDEAQARLDAFKKQVEEQATKRITTLESKYKTDLSAMTGKYDTTRKQFFETAVTSAAQRAIAANKGSEPLLLPVIRSSVRMTEGDDGKLTIEVLGADGQPRLSPQGGTTALMTIDELVEEFKGDEQFGRAFDGTKSSGSGAQNGARQSSGAFVISSADARNPQAYRAAKADAEKAGGTLEIGA